MSKNLSAAIITGSATLIVIALQWFVTAQGNHTLDLPPYLIPVSGLLVAIAGYLADDLHNLVAQYGAPEPLINSGPVLGSLAHIRPVGSIPGVPVEASRRILDLVKAADVAAAQPEPVMTSTELLRAAGHPDTKPVVPDVQIPSK